MVDHRDQIDEILRRVPVHVDDLNDGRGHPGESEHIRQLNPIGPLKLVLPGRDIELNRVERLPSQLDTDLDPPGRRAASVGRERHRLGSCEAETVGVEVDHERIHHTLVQLLRVGDSVAQAKIDVLRQPSIVAQPHLHGHATLDHPLTRLRPLKTCHEPFEHHPATQSGQRDMYLPRRRAEPVLQRTTQRDRRLISHDAPTRPSARST